MFADREQRQPGEAAFRELRLDRAKRIGRGGDDGAIVYFRILSERHRLKPQHRRQQHLKPPSAQRRRGGLAIGLRAGADVARWKTVASSSVVVQVAPQIRLVPCGQGYIKAVVSAPV